MAYFVMAIDNAWNRTTYDYEHIHNNTDRRLEKLEEMFEQDKKENKKLDFKTKTLCKFANLFNNPNYEICNSGFDAQQVQRAINSVKLVEVRTQFYLLMLDCWPVWSFRLRPFVGGWHPGRIFVRRGQR